MRAVLTAAELEQRLAAEFPEAFHGDSGLAILEAGDRAARVRFMPPGNAVRPGGTISGPTLMMLADVAMYVAVLASIGWCRSRSPPTSTSISCASRRPAG